ncbi:MAG: hypothetical protein DRP87_09550 [Spirochaetes bacterium]|nr:MAG: hypothetical protein DRP87_09550 [Spirochaetota bacterium]
MFEQVQSRKYYMQIVNQIRNLISEGKLNAGDKLPPERVLAQEFGTSRASIREALSALEMLGLIESRSGYGNVIKVDGTESLDGEMFKTLLKDHSPYEIFESRLVIEPNLAFLAAERATPEEIQEMGEILERLNKTGREIKNDPLKVEPYMEEDRKFHLQIGKCAHNSVLYTVFSGVNSMMKEAHWRTLKTKGLLQEGNLEKYEDEHTGIFNAIRSGKKEVAKVQMHDHIKELKKDIFDMHD